MIFNVKNKKELDIAAIESVSFANNYNNYIFELISEYVEGSNVLDFGAGYGQFTQFIQQKNKNVVAIEVNEKAISKLDELQIPNYKSLDTLQKKFETVVSLNVLEHIDDPKLFYKQIDKCLKSGGWFCARTPHKYCYVSIFATLFKNSLHSKLLKRIQPERKEIDVFPTKYKMNTMKDITKAFEAWENKSFIYKSEPDYYFGNKVLYYLQSCIHKFLPVQIYGNLFIFVKKP